MEVYYSDAHKEHNPPYEGCSEEGYKPSLEIPERAIMVLNALTQTGWAEILPPIDFGLGPDLEIHTAPYLDYLKSAYNDWELLSPVPKMAFPKFRPTFPTFFPT